MVSTAICFGTVVLQRQRNTSPAGMLDLCSVVSVDSLKMALWYQIYRSWYLSSTVFYCFIFILF